MKKIQRILQHLTSTRSLARRTFPAATLKAIQSGIAHGETLHRAEIRVIIEAALPWSALWHGDTARTRAHELFARYRLWDTEENCGILLYINLADRKVEILPDRAVARAIKRDDWHAVCKTITQGFAAQKYHDSVLQGLAQLNAMLEAHFPAEGKPHQNQLSDKPLLL